jgi:hypothetical protein
MVAEELDNYGELVDADAEVLREVHRDLVLELDRLRGLRHRIWILLGREDGTGLDIELLDAVADAVSAAHRNHQPCRAEGVTSGRCTCT